VPSTDLYIAASSSGTDCKDALATPVGAVLLDSILDPAKPKQMYIEKRSK
jgi:hypothetical protein